MGIVILAFSLTCSASGVDFSLVQFEFESIGTHRDKEPNRSIFHKERLRVDRLISYRKNSN